VVVARVTMEEGSMEIAQVCLPDGEYKPYACGGKYPSEVSWTWAAGTKVFSGTAGVSCSNKLSGGVVYKVENSPIPAAITPSPTKSPMSNPSPQPTIGLTYNFGVQEYVL
jgi:hypothetical protein